MRRALLMVVGVVVTFVACRTTQPPGTENAQPIQSGTDSQQGQIMAAEPPGPTGPMSPRTEDDAGTPLP